MKLNTLLSRSLAVGAVGACLFSPAPASAQDTSTLTVEILNRVAALEEQNRELRGEIEETRHEIDKVKQTVEVLTMDASLQSGGQGAGTPAPIVGAAPSVTAPQDMPSRSRPMASQQTDLAAPSNPATEGEYEQARSLLEQGNYSGAESAFSNFVSAHPSDPNAASAQYWLGVTYFVRGQHDKAVTAFAKGYKSYPQSPKAPDGLMKLAKSLAALSRLDDACTTLDQLASAFPNQKQNALSEKKALRCKQG